MTHTTKTNRAIAKINCHKGSATIDAILAQIPKSVIDNCTSSIIADVANAINNAYHAHDGADIQQIDGDGVWFAKLNRIVDISDIARIKKTERVEKLIGMPCESEHGTYYNSIYYYVTNIRFADGTPVNPMASKQLLFDSARRGDCQPLICDLHRTIVETSFDEAQ